LKLAALIAVLAALVVSGIKPFERFTWWLEVAPVLIAAPVLVWTHKRFPLTSLLYILITIHALVLILGGAYSYARVPFGFWLQDLLHLERNPYDRIGHFMQGVVPAMIAREILLRGSPRSHRSPGFTTGSSSDLQSEDEPQLGR
jgi:putative membrane protein